MGNHVHFYYTFQFLKKLNYNIQNLANEKWQLFIDKKKIVS